MSVDVCTLQQELKLATAALVEIIDMAENAADYAPDLVGHPQRWELLAGRMADVARAALRDHVQEESR